jgi:DNA-directed RNA polymerase specialized sigma subunit
VHNLPDPLPYAETLELIVKAQAGSVTARNAAITGNLRLVARIAESTARSAGRLDLLDDLIMAGAMGMAAGDGLAHAVMHFDAARGTRFATYAHPFIREAVDKQLASLRSDLCSYKTNQVRTLVRNRAARLAARLGRQPTPAEVHAALAPSTRRDCSLRTVELALAPPGREIYEESGSGNEDDAIAALDRSRDAAAMREAALRLLTEAQRELLSRRYSGERLGTRDRAAADEAEAVLRAALVG